MNITLIGAILASLLLIGGPAFAADTLSLYDNFNPSSAIDRTKWTGSAHDSLDVYRGIVFPAGGDGELRLDARGWGFRTNNAMPADLGEGRGTSNRLKFRRLDTDNVRAIQATVKVNGASATGCAAPGSEVTQARFQIGGSFFNDGTGEPGQATGDVIARLEIRRLSSAAAGQLDVRAKVARCAEPNCVLEDVLLNKVIGTTTVGATNTLLLQWNRNTNQFIFQLNSSAAVTYSYTMADTRGPQNNFEKKYIGIGHWIPNCIPTPTNAFMSVNVDDVSINTDAVAGP